MGVPALFRWLSKKYPKIVVPVIEEEAVKILDQDGNEVEIPIDITKPNPNGIEFDNLYIDMNGVVHPCAHPEGKPAPETEEAMMVEIFKYTEKVVNMVRPRKLLMLAIDGVAPRAKMNQQRSRRFRAAQEAKEKEEAMKEGIAIFKAMGHEVSQETSDSVKPPWDSNAITPGTPFMDLLAASLRYWVALKLNTDGGWKHLKVVISDASVPGEGEHKIMDYIRRQRVQPGYNPNTHHVIHGLDADLIMLALATHEPHFKVLREDVFAQERSTACRICGQEGHYAAQCTGVAKVPQDQHDVKKSAPEKQPHIFMDVSILREYLEIDLNVPQQPFPFDLERAIDDWVVLIFFVGNDFLPHLPSLEIREGAIDVLLGIWKRELPRLGGYLTYHGQLELSRTQIIMEGLAHREDDIFKKRREAEERQDQNAKRRKLEQEARKNGATTPQVIASTSSTNTPSRPPPPTPTSDLRPPGAPHPLPMRPSFDTFAAAPTPDPATSRADNLAEGTKALSGSNHDIVANRKAIRMANMSAAEAMKAELANLTPLKPRSSSSAPITSVQASVSAPEPVSTESLPSHVEPQFSVNSPGDMDGEIPGLEVDAITQDLERGMGAGSLQDIRAAEAGQGNISVSSAHSTGPPSNGIKRKIEEVDAPDDGVVTVEEEDQPDKVEEVISPSKRIVNSDGTVSQEDTVRLWEPGYRDRYYRQKFEVEPNDDQFRAKITKCYVEGLSWVLHYYYQGTPSWKWFYPYHYAPFAADFLNIASFKISFEIGQPFKPFEQLMGVLPAASRKHLPENFQSLMTEDDSPIIDFYPSSFEIDMNGKKMAWQGVALLSFIDEARLLGAILPLYENLTEEERTRNKWGSNVLFVSDKNTLHPFLEGLYIKRKSKEPATLDPYLSQGMSGSALPDPNCIPRATYYCPLEPSKIPHVTPPLSDIYDDRSISALFYFPKQTVPHRSVLLGGLRRPARVLNSADYEMVRSGGGRGRGRGGGGPPGYGHHSMHRELGPSSSYSEYSRGGYDHRGSYGDRGGYGDRGPYGDRGRYDRGGYDDRGYGYSRPYEYPQSYDGRGNGRYSYDYYPSSSSHGGSYGGHGSYSRGYSSHYR